MKRVAKQDENEIVTPDVSAETQRILGSLSDEQWLVYHHDLIIYTERKCRRLHWRSGDIFSLPGGNTPETLVEEAITRLFEGRRSWNHERYPGQSPVPFLKGLIDSLVSDLVRGEDQKRTAFLEDETTTTNSEGESYEVRLSSVAGAVPGFQSSQPDDPERAVFLRELLQRIRERIEDRPDLAAYFEHSGDGHSPAEISSLMNLEIDKVYQLRKLLIARIKPLITELFHKR